MSSCMFGNTELIRERHKREVFCFFISFHNRLVLLNDQSDAYVSGGHCQVHCQYIASVVK